MSNERGSRANTLRRALSRFDRLILPVENTVTVICFGLMCFVVLYGVVCRFLLKIPNPYGEEISKYLMIFAVYFAVAIGARRKEHIRVDFLINALPGRLGKAVDILGALVTCAGYLLLTVLSNQMLFKMMATRQRAPSLRIPLYLVYIALVVGMALAFLHSVETFLLDHVIGEAEGDPSGEGE